MYSVVLVSTAKHIINDFGSNELWKKIGFTLKAVVRTVDEALNIHPDVILCPIRNENTDGAAFTEKIKEEDIRIKTVLYGRKTYEAVKLAIDAGADGYMPLPFEVDEFENVFNRLKKALKDVKHSRITVDDTEKRVNYFISVLNGLYSESKAKEKFDGLMLTTEYENTACSFVAIKFAMFEEYVEKSWKYGKDAFYNAVNNFIAKSNNTMTYIPINNVNGEIYGVFLKENATLGEHSLTYIKKSLTDIMHTKISIDNIASFESVKQLNMSEQKSEIAKALKLIENDEEQDTGDISNAVILAKEYINASFDKDIGLTDVADYVGLSGAYLSRMFKQATNENFIDYLMKIRMEKAKKLIEEKDKSLSEIGNMVGYSNSKYFGKLFKNYTGYTPTEYKARIRK